MNRAHLLDVLMDHRKTCLSTAIKQNLVGKDCIFLHPPGNSKVRNIPNVIMQ